MKFAILGLLVLIVIGFFVLIWKSSRDWRWYNLVAASFSMLLAIAFLFPTAGVLKSRSAWHQLKENLELDAMKLASEQRLLKYGDPANPEAGEGIAVLNRKLAKIGIEAGRRWRSLRMQNVANNVVTLGRAQSVAPGAAAPAPADAEEGAAPVVVQPLIPDGTVVYGFAEVLNEQQIAVPVFYLGEFRVTGSTPNQVTLSPTGPLEADQQQRINNQARSWSLYEMLPMDGHVPFIAEGSVPGDDNTLGRIDADLVNRMLGKNVSAETLKNYLEDGRRLEKGDPPVSRWTKIEFLKGYALDVDSPESRGALDGGFFDGNGRAVDSRLQRGEDGQVKFKKGDQILVKEEGGDQLIDDGTAKLIDSYYLRPLNDYRFVLRRIRLRLTELADRTKELEFEKGVLTEAVERTTRMQVTNREIQNKLEQDFQQFRTEKRAMESYAKQVQSQLDSMKAELLRLYRENQGLEQKLDQQHRSVQQQPPRVRPVSRVRL